MITVKQEYISFKKEYREAIKYERSSTIKSKIDLSKNKSKTVWEIINSDKPRQSDFKPFIIKDKEGNATKDPF